MIPFQRPPYLDDDAIRERVARNLDLLLDARDAGDARTRLQLLGQIGNDQRMMGNLLEADMFLSEAVALAHTLGDRMREATNLIRLATARQYSGQHVEAEPMFRKAVARTDQPEAAMYHDFALRHLAKLLIETGRVEEGVRCFEQALSIRQAKGDAELIESTATSLAAAQSLLPFSE